MEYYRKDFEALRRRSYETIAKLQKIQTGTGTAMDAASIHGEVKDIDADYAQIEAAGRQLATKVDQGEARTMDEQLRYLKQRIQTLKQNYSSYCQQGKMEVYLNEADYNGGYEQAQQLKMTKDQQVDALNEKTKVLKQQNLLINEKLNEGGEIISYLHSDVNDARDKVKISTSKVDYFNQYLKKNKAPFWSAVVLIIISVFLWSTKAFCSIGLTWQCP